MKKFDFSKARKNAGKILLKNAPSILTGIGIVGMLTSTVLAVQATPKAELLLEEKKREENKESLTLVETIQTAGTCYIPSAVTSILSIVCLISANSVSSKRNAALATACSIAETTLLQYRDKVVETIGEKKERDIRDSIAKDEINAHPLDKQQLIVTSKGETRCYDKLSDRYFTSSIDALRRIENDLNRQMLNGEDYISLNELYYAIGLKETELGDQRGWNVRSGLIEMYFSAQICPDGVACIVVDHVNPPTCDFMYA